MLGKLPENCPICRGKMAKGYVSASPDVYWSEKKVTWRFWRTRWEALLGGRFAKWIQPVNAEAYRCPNCKVVLFSYEKDRNSIQSTNSLAGTSGRHALIS